MKHTLLIVLLSCILLLAPTEARRYRNLRGGLKEGLKYRAIPTYDDAPQPQWFTQTVDHFDPLNNATFQQLYYVNDTYWSGPGGPIFILLGGEGPLEPSDVLDHFVLPIYAAKFGALIVAVEHRFYGQSMPAPDLSTPNLRLLNSPQALADYALFQQYITQKYNAVGSKWISFGGSYSGALSAWYRASYPHLIAGSIATSAPVQAKLEFQEYFEVVQQSVGPQCAARIKNVTNIVSKMLSTSEGTQQLEKIFSTCTPIVSQDDIITFMSSLTDGVCEIVQYNQDNNAYTPFNLDKMCSMLLEGSSDDEQLASYATFNNVFNQFSGENCTGASYQQMIAEMQSTDPSNPAAAGRSWTWQTCIEYGYFQTGSSPNQPFSPLISLEWFLKQCNDIFGIPLTPSVAAVNALFGSTAIRSSNIVFPNGSIDPWHILGVLESPCRSEPTSFMNGTAHCADLYPPTPNDLPELTNTRTLEVSLIANWLQDTC
jgi:hypothetical protein